MAMGWPGREGAMRALRLWTGRAGAMVALLGLALAAAGCGPTYVVRDRYVNFKSSAVKVSVNSRGIVYLYHVLGRRPDGNAKC